jgi:LmbE family N-acetylglucosaminyl deacetylase
LSARDLVAWLAGDSRARGPRTVVLVAHPDDETVGIGGLLAEIDPHAIVIATDGAPRNAWFWRKAGCANRRAYAALRRRELADALRAGGVPAGRVRWWPCVDQEAARDLRWLTAAARRLFDELTPELVLTHPYEGGHPDHDAIAFAAHAALAATPVARRPALVEMAFYHQDHRGRGVPVWGRFAGRPGRRIVLDAERRARKRAMVACHRSQARVLAACPLDAEHVRPAPAYDFTAPPPGGAFLYDAFGWPLQGADFLRAAAMASSITDPS